MQRARGEKVESCCGGASCKCPTTRAGDGVVSLSQGAGIRGWWSATRLLKHLSLEGTAGSQGWRSLQQSPVSLVTARISPLHKSLGLTGGEEPFFLDIILCYLVQGFKCPHCFESEWLGDGRAPPDPSTFPGMKASLAAAGSLLQLLSQELLPSCFIPALSDCHSVFLYIRQ